MCSVSLAVDDLTYETFRAGIGRRVVVVAVVGGRRGGGQVVSFPRRIPLTAPRFR